MKLLKNTKFAASIAVIVCILSMFIGTNKSLAALAEKTEKMFSTGTMSPEGYRLPSIESQHQVLSDMALGLVTVANNYPELIDKANTLATIRNYFMNAHGIHEKAQMSVEFAAAFDSLSSATDNIVVSDRDRKTIEDYKKDFYSAQKFILTLADGYNAEVVKYESAAGKFPANVFGVFTNVPDKY